MKPYKNMKKKLEIVSNRGWGWADEELEFKKTTV